MMLVTLPQAMIEQDILDFGLVSKLWVVKPRPSQSHEPLGTVHSQPILRHTLSSSAASCWLLRQKRAPVQNGASKQPHTSGQWRRTVSHMTRRLENKSPSPRSKTARSSHVDSRSSLYRTSSRFRAGPNSETSAACSTPLLAPPAHTQPAVPCPRTLSAG